MEKKARKKPLFVMKETLVHLTPRQMGQVQGAKCSGATDGWDLMPTTCTTTK